MPGVHILVPAPRETAADLRRCHPPTGDAICERGLQLPATDDARGRESLAGADTGLDATVAVRPHYDVRGRVAPPRAFHIELLKFLLDGAGFIGQRSAQPDMVHQVDYGGHGTQLHPEFPPRAPALRVGDTTKFSSQDFLVATRRAAMCLGSADVPNASFGEFNNGFQYHLRELELILWIGRYMGNITVVGWTVHHITQEYNPVRFTMCHKGNPLAPELLFPPSPYDTLEGRRRGGLHARVKDYRFVGVKSETAIYVCVADDDDLRERLPSRARADSC